MARYILGLCVLALLVSFAYLLNSLGLTHTQSEANANTKARNDTIILRSQPLEPPPAPFDLPPSEPAYSEEGGSDEQHNAPHQTP